MSLEEILQETKAIDDDARTIKLEAMRAVWYLRGGLSFAEAMNLSPEERELVLEIVKDNIETTKTSGLPFF